VSTTVQFLVKGRVQGVGFRRFVLHHAHALQLKGFVCNLEDGSVECIAQGDSTSLTELEMLLRQGPRFAAVSDVVCTDMETDTRQYNQFRIL
jgi:acylphosphatase